MAVISSFPLFNLPLLPLNEIISNMCPVELLWMSLVSRKTADLVKGKQTIDLKVIKDEPTSDCEIVCKDQNGSNFLSIVMKNIEHIDQFNDYLAQKIDDLIVAIKVENTNITTFWRDEVEGYHAIVSVLCNVFRIRSIFIKAHVLDTNILPKESKNNIPKVLIAARYLNGMVFNYILDSLRDVPELEIESILFASYQHNIVCPAIDNCYCVIRNAYWFAFKDMNKLTKCINIELWDLKWTSEELNQFLKIWMDSIMMKMVDITVDKIDFKIAIEGLQVTPQRKMKFQGLTRGVRDCFVIQRNDGEIAVLWSHGKTFVMQNYHN